MERPTGRCYSCNMKEFPHDRPGWIGFVEPKTSPFGSSRFAHISGKGGLRQNQCTQHLSSSHNEPFANLT
jgi:hypothetical protein